MSNRDDAARVSDYFDRRDRQAARDVAAFMDEIGYTAEDFAADMAEGGSIEVREVRSFRDEDVLAFRSDDEEGRR